LRGLGYVLVTDECLYSNRSFNSVEGGERLGTRERKRPRSSELEGGSR